MDQPDVSRHDLQQSLAFIRGVNHYLGGSRAVINHLARWSAHWPADQPIRILDVATGSADIPLAIAQWARQHNHRVQIVGLDLHPATLDLAAAWLRDKPGSEAITLVRGNALDPPFDPDSFDYCITSMFLHHLPDIEVMTALRQMHRLATRGLIWNDLNRHRMAKFWIKLLTLRSSPIVQHDARVSVDAGFTRPEVLDFRNRLELDYLEYHQHFGHRFTLAGEM